MLWLAEFSLVAVVLCVAVWHVSTAAAAVVVAVIAAAWSGRTYQSGDDEEWKFGAHADHKRSVFYDPVNYDDDPDPRFNDER